MTYYLLIIKNFTHSIFGFLINYCKIRFFYTWHHVPEKTKNKKLILKQLNKETKADNGLFLNYEHKTFFHHCLFKLLFSGA